MNSQHLWKKTGGARADVVILEEEENYIFGDGRGIEGNHEEVCDIVPSQVADVLRRHAGFAAVEESPPRMTEEGEGITLHSCPCSCALLPRYQFNNSCLAM